MLNYLMCKCTCLGGGPSKEISASVDILNLDILNAELNKITIDLKLKFMLNYTTLNRGDILYVQKEKEFSIKENKIKGSSLDSGRMISLDQLANGYSGIVESTLTLSPDVYVVLFLRAVQRFDPDVGWKFLGNSQPFSLDLESDTAHDCPGSLMSKNLRESAPSSQFSVKNSSKIEKFGKSIIDSKPDEEAIMPRKIIFNPEESKEESLKALATTKASFNSVGIPGRETVSFLDSKRNFDSIFEEWSPEKPKLVAEYTAEPDQGSGEKEVIGTKKVREAKKLASPREKDQNEGPANKEQGEGGANKENIKSHINRGNNRYSNVAQNSKEKPNSGKRGSHGKHSAGFSSSRSAKTKESNPEIEVKSFDPTFIYKETMKKYNQTKVMMFPTKAKKSGLGVDKPLADKRI